MLPGLVVIPETVGHAVKLFIENKQVDGVSKNWERKLTRELGDLAKWCDRKLISLRGVNLLALENYRKTWEGAAVTRRKRQERLRSFFSYCAGHESLDKNVAGKLSTIKVSDPPTLPLTREQFDAVVTAVARYNPKAPDGAWRRLRALTMILLLRWSGLRISDAAKLERSALMRDDGSLQLYTQKTGEPVYVPLPPHVVKLLQDLPIQNPPYFFWNEPPRLTRLGNAGGQR